MKYLLTFFSLIGLLGLGDAAIIQEPVLSEPGTFKTRFLFLEKDMTPHQGPLNTPSLVPEKKSSNPLLSSSIPFLSSNGKFQGTHGNLTVTYVRPTEELVQSILKKYKTIPGGITLEGKAVGLEPFAQWNYDPALNLIRMGDHSFNPGISTSETKEILDALKQDDLIGVSLGEEDLVYGKLREGSITSVFLKLGDHYLGSLVFAASHWRGHALPGGYRLKHDTENDGAYAVYFNFKDVKFEKNEGMYHPIHCQMEITLIPMKSNENGGFEPDFQKIKLNRYSKAYESNIHHLTQHMDSYRDDPRIQRVIRYAEIAALIRFLLT